MILSDIKRYLSERRQASLQDIALHFDADPQAVRGMLDHWVRKGKIVMQTATASCGSSCSDCSSERTEIYFWIGDGRAEGRIPELPVAAPCRR